MSFQQSLDRGYTLPAEWYTDPAVFSREKERIFASSWQWVGLAEQVRSPGDFFTYRAADIPIVVVRGEAGELRGFINVCRHRGSELVLEERGCRKSLQCHYHAWTYNLDGTLRVARGSELEDDFDPGEFSLIPVAVDTWGPLIFVNPHANCGRSGRGRLMPSPLGMSEVSGGRFPPPVSSDEGRHSTSWSLPAVLGELPELVAGTGIDLSRLRRRITRTYDIAANWKVVVDNYLECYHCPVAHRGFSDLIDVNEYTVTEYEYFSVQSANMRKQGGNGKGAGFNTEGVVQEGFYAFLWPNFTINIYPGPGNVSFNRFLPVDAEHTRAVFDYCFVDEVTDEDVRNFDRFIDQVQREDTVLCESVQRGMRSGFFSQGRLMLSRESALQHFQRLVCDVVS